MRTTFPLMEKALEFIDFIGYYCFQVVRFFLVFNIARPQKNTTKKSKIGAK